MLSQMIRVFKILNVMYYDSWQVKDAEHRLRHKLFPPNAWMKLTDFNVLTSCPKDELHQWFLGLYEEHIIPAMVRCCELGVRYPSLRAMMNRADLNLRYSVRFYSYEILNHRLCTCCVYT